MRNTMSHSPVSLEVRPQCLQPEVEEPVHNAIRDTVHWRAHRARRWILRTTRSLCIRIGDRTLSESTNVYAQKGKRSRVSTTLLEEPVLTKETAATKNAYQYLQSDVDFRLNVIFEFEREIGPHVLHRPRQRHETTFFISCACRPRCTLSKLGKSHFPSQHQRRRFNLWPHHLFENKERTGPSTAFNACFGRALPDYNVFPALLGTAGRGWTWKLYTCSCKAAYHQSVVGSVLVG